MFEGRVALGVSEERGSTSAEMAPKEMKEESWSLQDCFLH